MTTHGISEDALLAQEACFARAFADGDPGIARDLYQPDVVYVSPTVRLFDWPARIEGANAQIVFLAERRNAGGNFAAIGFRRVRGVRKPFTIASRNLGKFLVQKW